MKRRYRSSREIDSVVDLERIRSGMSGCFERDARLFLDLTYPTQDIHRMLRGLSARFSGQGGAGCLLAQSQKGLGKSHTLLTGYHLFASPEVARVWAARLGYAWEPPSRTITLVHKFTDESAPEDALWLLVGRALGASWGGDRPPCLDELRTAIGERFLVLILDELERGIDNIQDPVRRSQNLSFLQMISEEATRDRQVTLFAAVYDLTREPGSTLVRTPRVELRFREPDDRAAVVRHRLFADADAYDRDAARELILSNANWWQRFGVKTPDPYLRRLETSFPILPDLIDLVFTKITESGGFQGTRSALGLLGAMLDAAGDGTYLLTAAHCRLADSNCMDRLQDLEPTGHVIRCAASNWRDLQDKPLAEPIASAVLLSSLVTGGRSAGMTAEELVRHVACPGTDPNEYQGTLDAFRRFGTYFHEREAHFFFDTEENENAKVEREAGRLQDEDARREIASIWRQEVFKDAHQSVVLTDLETTKLRLQGLSKQGQRWILSPRRLSVAERHALYDGLEMRNQVLLLEPRDDRTDHLHDRDLLAFAKRQRAAETLLASASGGERRKRYEDIKKTATQQIQLSLRSSGVVYVRIERWSDHPEQCEFEEESLQQFSTKEDVLQHLRSHLYPDPHFEEHIRDNLRQHVGQRVEQLDRMYRNTLGYPVPLSMSIVWDAVRTVASDRARLAGLRHSRGNFCGESVTLSEPDLMQAVLSEPWVESLPPAKPLPDEGANGVSILSGSEAPAPVERQPVAHSVSTEQRSTRQCRSRLELREQIASHLLDMRNPIVREIRFSLMAGSREEELSTYPAAYRGSLVGRGDLDLQITLVLRGAFSKAEVESLCDGLPQNLPDATYAAKLTIEVSSGVFLEKSQ